MEHNLVDHEIQFRKYCLNEIYKNITNLELSFDYIQNKKLLEQINRKLYEMKELNYEINSLLNGNNIWKHVK